MIPTLADRPWIVTLACCVLVLPTAAAQEDQFRPSPHFTGDSIPTPPQQNAPFTPPETKLPQEFVEAAQLLFEQGMADPRGCEYREVEVGVASRWLGDAGLQKVHGWVLPAEPGETQRFAVCWNGLVYPVASVGGKADVRADVEAGIRSQRRFIAREGIQVGSLYRLWWLAVPEEDSVWEGAVTSVKACLLLRLGEGALAQKVWHLWRTDLVLPDRNEREEQDAYLALAVDWSWALFNRAVCAFMRGDDELALISARALVPIQQSIEAEAENRPGSTGRPTLPFLWQLPELIADLERRAAEQALPEPVLAIAHQHGDVALNDATMDRLWKDLEVRYPDKGERIALLVCSLDEVGVRQFGQPGWVEFRYSAPVQALIQEGEDAIEPLLQCLENDTRLTRSVHFWRNSDWDRTVRGVQDAACEALQDSSG